MPLVMVSDFVGGGGVVGTLGLGLGASFSSSSRHLMAFCTAARLLDISKHVIH